MSRFLYGGGGDGDIIKPTGVPYINATATVHDSRAGGTQITDLQNAAGSTINSVVTDANGQALFYGPDNFISVLWLDFGSGVRWALGPKATDLAAVQAVSVQRAADALATSSTTKAKLPYSAADPLEQKLATALDPLVIARFSSQSARDAAFPSPVAGDRCYRTDLHLEQVYNSALGLWRTASFAYNYGSVGGNSGVRVSSTTAETALTLSVVPANPVAGATYRVTAFGYTTQSANDTPTITFRLRIGGVTGTFLASNQFQAASDSSPSNRPWQMTGHITVLTTGGTGSWFGNLTGHSAITSTGSTISSGASLRTNGDAAGSRSTTVDQQMVLTVQWDTSSASNLCVMYGWTWERIN
jgi:hypothetical protein